MDSFFSSSSTSSPDTRTSSREGTINRYFDKDLFSSHDVMEMFRNTSDAVNEEPCQEFLTKLGVLLEDSPPEDVIPKYKQLVFKFIREMVNMKNFNSLELYLPNIMQYTQQLYTFNSLMETEMGVNDYFKFVSILVLEYLKTHFYPCTIIGGDKEQGVMYVVLTYLYRNEGAIMDVLFQLTFWLENSLAKSHIHAENLFNLIRKLFNSLIVQSRHYLSARHTNLSIINYIRVLLLFKVLKHLETECNVANASDVTIDFSIDSGIELVVLGLPIHRNLEPVLGLLGRVFPETKMSLFRGKMRQFLTTEDYYIFERIVGLLDFVQLHTESIDLKGNFNLKPMQWVPYDGG